MMKENGKLSLSLVAELVCCLLGGCAFCSAVLPAMGQDAGLLDCLLYVFVDLSLIFLLSRRWWIAPALIAAAAVIGAGIVYFFHFWEPVKEYCLGFAEWYGAAYPYTLPYSENGSLFLVHLAFSFPVTLVLYIFFRRIPFLPVWVLLSGGLLYWMHISSSQQMLAAAAMLLIATLVLLARTNAYSINRKLGRGEKIPSASMQFTALILAPIVVLFAFAFGPKTEGAWRSQGLVNLVQDVRDVFSFYGEGSYGEGNFDLGFSGLAPHGMTLGGDIEPNNRTVMRVKTSTPILLAGAVYDSYNGYGWYDTGAGGRFRFVSPLWRGKRREVFTVGKPSDRKAAEPYGKVTRVASLEISLVNRFRSLFAGGKMEGLTMPAYGDAADVYFNSQGELFTLEVPDISMNYVIKTRVFARDREDFDENMRELVRLAAASRDREYEEIQARYTEVSELVEPFVRELAAEITAGCDNDYDKALAIEKWISENCTYTKTPGDGPLDRDFLSAFLETREGYCTYYATAMAILARISGLPARYVTGYGLKQADRKPATTSYIATNATAHAWAQVYFYGVGWVDFDPVEWEFYELVETDAPIVRDPKPVQTPVTPEIPKPEIPEPEPEEPEPGEDIGPQQGSRTWRIVLIVLLGDLGAFLIFLGIRAVLLIFKVENFYYRLIRRYPDNRTRADECYRRIIRQLGFLGLEMQPSDTIMSFSQKADELLGSAPGHEPMQKACQPVVLSRFAMRKPTDGQLKRMCDFYIFLEKELRQKLGLKDYILHRMILGR
ncbi:MAG: transglutaminase domain-containing protein [Oscillospiraceae bacterium]|nr:transglutaminase domain-containing protein [Oscillospiraceae bacterium]